LALAVAEEEDEMMVVVVVVVAAAVVVVVVVVVLCVWCVCLEGGWGDMNPDKRLLSTCVEVTRSM
jgi:hypothetical protein